MLRKKSESLEWLEFEIFQPFPRLKHGVFLRHAEASPEMYREKIRRQLDCSTLVRGKQIHGKKIERVPLLKEGVECDGLITQEKETALFINHADCQAAIFYDTENHAVGCVHAGWRGNVQNIYAEVVKEMERAYGSKPENLRVGISPSLGPCCGEFVNYKNELPEEFWAFQTKPLYFDLWQIARSQLQQAGVLPDHIEIAEICTCCNLEDYFSYRRDKTTGRHGTVAVLSDRR